MFDARETAPAKATEDMFKDVPSDIGKVNYYAVLINNIELKDA